MKLPEGLSALSVSLTPRADLRCLWRNAQLGDPRARSELCEEVSSLSRYFAVSGYGHGWDREDLSQDVIASVLTGLEELTCPRSLSGFVKYRTWSIASRHKKRLSCRRSVNAEEEGLDDIGLPEYPPWQAMSQDEEALALHECIAELPPLQGLCIRLRFVEDQPVHEIADDQGVSTTAIYKRIEAAFGSLLPCLRCKGVRL